MPFPGSNGNPVFLALITTPIKFDDCWFSRDLFLLLFKFFSDKSNSSKINVKLIILLITAAKEEQSEGTVDRPFMICTLGFIHKVVGLFFQFYDPLPPPQRRSCLWEVPYCYLTD